MRWHRRHPILASVAAVLIGLFVVAGIVGKNPSSTTSTSTTQSTRTSRPGRVQAPPSVQQAVSYINQRHIDAEKVQATVQVVQIDIGSKSSGNQLAQDAQAAHDLIDSLRDNFAQNYDSGPLGDAEVQVWVAAGDVRDAMFNLVTYAGTPNPATLVKFTNKYQSALGEWNAGVRYIWRAARRRGAPTL